MYQILVVDDEPAILRSLKGVLEDEGYGVVLASNGAMALKESEGDVDAVVLDLMLPDMDGLEVLRRIRARNADLPVIMISGHGSISVGVEAVRMGAYHFIEKPLCAEKVLVTIENALERERLKRENVALRQAVEGSWELVGESAALCALRGMIERVAPTEGRVLIQGETGTGKELVARAIHRGSQRADGSFVKVNCAAIPKDLIESELFGHERGAFTGATSSRKGKFELADRGTLFLDEIGDMALETQAKVLRALQEGEIERVGGTRVIRVDVRVIAATNKDLEAEIRAGRFREDLFWRLNVVPLHVPPLRDREGDVWLLSRFFLEEVVSRNGRGPKGIAPEAFSLLERHPWPGNVRELKNSIERLVILSEGEVIAPEDVALALGGTSGGMQPSEESLRERVEHYEREIVLRELKANAGNVSQTARDLQVDRANLQRKLRTWGVRGCLNG